MHEYYNLYHAEHGSIKKNLIIIIG